MLKKKKKKNSVPIFFHTVKVGGLINAFLSKLSKRYQQNYQLSTTLFTMAFSIFEGAFKDLFLLTNNRLTLFFFQ